MNLRDYSIHVRYTRRPHALHALFLLNLWQYIMTAICYIYNFRYLQSHIRTLNKVALILQLSKSYDPIPLFRFNE